ncbi:MAG TPA: glycosyltransferase family 1 protein [Puia sp.]|nr:glycosyltransferase family 1 protein [Puia sp.]
MRIGIDAKWLFRGPVSTRVVLQNLLPELFTLYPDNEWIVFMNKKDKHVPFPFDSVNVKPVYLWAEINFISNVFLLAGKLKALRLDVMVYQTFPALAHKLPTISFIHDVLFREFSQFFTWRERLYFSPMSWLARNRSDRLIATTEYVANDLLKYHYTNSKSRIDLVPLAVSNAYRPLEYQNPQKLKEVKEKYGLPDQFLLFVGRLNVRKNIENLLKAILLIRDRQIKLVIVGKADWKTPDLKAMLSKPELKRRIILTGAMTDEELILTYSLARIFCFPSFAEGFGLPPLESMASGVPVIVSAVTALPEVCGDGALYIDPNKPECIAQAVDELLGDEEFYIKQRNKGLQRAKTFTWAYSAKSLMESISKVVNVP